MISLGSYWNDGKKWFFAVTEDGVSTTNAYEGRQGAIRALGEAGYTESEANKLLTNIVVRRFDDADILDAPADCRILEDEDGLKNYVAVDPSGMRARTVHDTPAAALAEAVEQPQPGMR
ncbi:hypothetical protein RFM26_08580 [Mesorhizobium sp. VK23B]|uniref:DUF1508 domain-containing protein n=1 Tax=Mesorhizobium dulcispinae TaxID=3072316 RepID=A0ABU4X9I6_9HYPH|nr:MULTISPECIES: hypothetical protein [unclassified Mesorhizobium]MDX8465737.1 hypothetical protein [Mesorhizobium sp. VK23B]MDX8471461.1 hypothetical protein [Mesorhizobium sp. VK23A]